MFRYPALPRVFRLSFHWLRLFIPRLAQLARPAPISILKQDTLYFNIRHTPEMETDHEMYQKLS
jgi:hypothetical protein